MFAYVFVCASIRPSPRRSDPANEGGPAVARGGEGRGAAPAGGATYNAYSHDEPDLYGEQYAPYTRCVCVCAFVKILLRF